MPVDVRAPRLVASPAPAASGLQPGSAQAPLRAATCFAVSATQAASNFSARGRPGSSSSSYTIRIPARLQPPPIPSLESLGRLLERPRSSAAESGDARIPRVALDSPVSSSGSVHALATATLASKPGRDRFHPPGVVFSGF
ncbi:hypothetical protein NDU88_000564 [Pleurodeles waltl]|uniref:Uncharacterized protein n=1 Tax=Pleurodeles waltl TaxID=8319 RepID=A0AAV7SX19_PLEWA|nr:hypothetical protein NDU88_000564 [Pleurodeles waltl]